VDGELQGFGLIADTLAKSVVCRWNVLDEPLNVAHGDLEYTGIWNT